MSRFDYWQSIKGQSLGSVHALGSNSLGSASVAGFGEISAEAIAAIVSAKTGIQTSARQIVKRANSAGIVAEGYRTTSRYQDIESTIAALASGFVDGGEPSSVAARLMPLIERFGNEYISRTIAVISQLGLDDTMAGIGRDIAGSMLRPIVDLVREIAGSFGDDSAFAAVMEEIGAAVGKAASEMTEMLPVIGGFYKLCQVATDWINAQLWLPSGSNQYAAVFKDDPINLYLYLAEKAGHGDVRTRGGAWSAIYNPFYGETFIHCTRLDAEFRHVRAIDIGNYTVGGTPLPDWRSVFTSDAAKSYIRGDFTGAYVVPGHSADTVWGCPCNIVGVGAYDGVQPARWSQGRPEFRAAAVASCAIAANVACMRGVGRWDSRLRAYTDQDPRYDLGIGFNPLKTTWMATWRDGDIKVLPPVDLPWWEEARAAALRTRGGALAVAEIQANEDQRCQVVRGGSTDDAFRQKIRDYMNEDRWVSLSSVTSRVNPDVPKKSIGQQSIRSIQSRVRSGLPFLDPSIITGDKGGGGAGTAVAVVGGVSVLALLAWLALK